jgi:hypothetical protein
MTSDEFKAIRFKVGTRYAGSRGPKALAAARVHQVPLVVAKVERLTRSVAFLSRLLEAGVDVRFADLAMIEGHGQIPAATDGGRCRAGGGDDLGRMSQVSIPRLCRRPWTEGADFGICQTFAASPAEPGELPCWLVFQTGIAITYWAGLG